MSNYTVTFSPTGGTSKVAGILEHSFGGSFAAIDLLDRSIDFSRYRFNPDDFCMVAVPSYGGRVPALAISRLKKMEGNGAKTLLVAVYGNRAYEDTLAELKDTLEERGFLCIAAVAAVAEHSIMRQFGAGRPDAEDEKVLAGFAERVRHQMEASTCPAGVWVPGNRPYREYHGSAMSPTANRNCVKCGTCEMKCPARAIPKENPSETEKTKCIACMRCIAVCPTHARANDPTQLAALVKKLEKVCTGRKQNELFC
jgi:ferredoxin